MSDIAHILSLKAQYQVSRLLKLKELRADVQRTMAIALKTWLQESGERYATAARLETAAEAIEAALESQLEDLFAEAAAEASIPKQRPTRSLFARRLCHYLHSRIPS